MLYSHLNQIAVFMELRKLGEQLPHHPADPASEGGVDIFQLLGWLPIF